jgi:hypothetical protein
MRYFTVKCNVLCYLRLNDDVDGDGRRGSSRGGEGSGRRLRGKVIID